MNREPDNLPWLPWHWPPRTVLVAVDFGDASARALAVGRAVAGAFEANLRAIYAERFDPPPYFTVEQLKRLVAERDIAQAAAADHLARFAPEAGAGAIEPVVVNAGPSTRFSTPAPRPTCSSSARTAGADLGAGGSGRWPSGSCEPPGCR
jgi:hypothetical protein